MNVMNCAKIVWSVNFTVCSTCVYNDLSFVCLRSVQSRHQELIYISPGIFMKKIKSNFVSSAVFSLGLSSSVHKEFINVNPTYRSRISKLVAIAWRARYSYWLANSQDWKYMIIIVMQQVIQMKSKIFTLLFLFVTNGFTIF